MSAGTPHGGPPPPNPPGRRALAWRPGTYATFLEAMLAQVPVRTVPGGGTAPLARLNTCQPGEFGVALLGAWAVVGDVVSFYQERILNEGFLRTAVEPRSVRELLRLTGYRRNPGVAASTALAFTLAPGPAESAAVVVPAGSAAQSIPAGGETAQTFETTAELRARPEWNALAPRIAVRRVGQALSAGDTALRLAGLAASLRPGDALLLEDAAGPAWSLSFVAAANAEGREGCTRVTLSTAAEGGTAGPLGDPRVSVFRQRLSLFGHKAVPWAQARDDARRAAMDPAGGVFRLDAAGREWSAASAGLPMAEVRAVLAASTGVFLAAVAGEGVFASRDGGASWVPSGTGMQHTELFALAEGPRGALYAAGADGNVFRSRDGGASWDVVAARTMVMVDPPRPAVDVRPAAAEASTAGAPERWMLGAVPARLPATIVRTLLAWTERDGSVTLAAGTDSGVYTASDGIGAWTALNTVAGQAAGAGGLADTAVLALARDPSGTLLAGTTAGVFRLGADGWTPANGNLPGTDSDSRFSTLAVTSLVIAADPAAHPYSGTWTGSAAPGGSASTPPAGPGAASAAWWIGTARGVWRGDPAAGTWTPASQGLPAGPGGGAVAVRALLAGGARLVAGTAAGVFQSLDGGRSWTAVAPTAHGAPPPAPSAPGIAPAPPGLNNPDVRALSGTPGAVLLAATPFLGFIDARTGAPQAEWPRFRTEGLTLDLDGRQTAVVPGSRVALWQGTVDGPSRSARATVREVEATRRTDFGVTGTVTRLTLSADAPLDGFDPRTATVFAAPEALTLDVRDVPGATPVAGAVLALQPVSPPLPAGRLLVVTGAPSRVALVPRAGVLAPRGDAWTPAGLAARDVRALAFAADGALWAATAAGVYALPDPAAPSPAAWTAARPGTPADARAVVLTRAGEAVAATAAGVLLAAPSGGAWLAVATVPAQAFGAVAEAWDGALWAAGTAGVFTRPAGGDTWIAGPAGLAGAPAALAAAPGALYAGTDAGVFRLRAGQRAWEPVHAGLANTDVRALAVDAEGGVYAGTAGDGVFHLPPHRDEWRALARGSLGRGDVRALAAAPDGTVYAGTYGEGAWRLAHGAAAWTALPTGAANHVAALAVDARGAAWAGCAAAPVLLSPDGLFAREAPLPRAATLPRSAAARLDRGGIAESVAMALSAAELPVDAAAYVAVRRPGSAWTLVQPSGAAFLDLQPEGIDVRVPAVLPVLSAAPARLGPEGTDADGVLAACPVVTDDGLAWTLQPCADEALPQPSAPSDATVSEVASAVAEAGPDGAVSLALPLAGTYDPATVTVAANVALATQGATVADEALGSGGPGQGSARFALRYPPLAYTPAPTPTGGASTLTVRVNGAAWREVDGLLGEPADARVYQVHTGPDGAATVAFGDGRDGARPPSGHENIRATYRTGGGAAGNVAAGQVSVPRRVPAGVRAVTNPLPGRGGVDPEGTAAAAAAAPLRLRALDRVVSPRDYADFARAYPGVARARADQLGGAGAPLVVTVAGAGGAAPDPAVVRGLAAAIAANRLNAVPFRVLAAEALPFQLRAWVAVDPAYDPDAVTASAREALRSAYAFARRDFGAPVLLSEMIVAVQRVEGVRTLEPEALFVTGLAPRLHPRLEAAPARRDPDTGLPRGAQLLLPHPTLGFTLAPMRA